MEINKVNKDSIDVKTKRLCVLMKEIYLHLLLGVNEDWDDDLLGDAIDLLS